jgi:hypothetical protein
MKVAPDHAAGDTQERRKLSTHVDTKALRLTSIRIPFNIPAANVDKSLAEVIRPRNSLELRAILDSNQWPSAPEAWREGTHPVPEVPNGPSQSESRGSACS